MAFIGETCSKRYLFTPENISDVALRLGDTNPAHHDCEMAADTRFGGLIASAGHSTGIFVSLLAEYFTQKGEAYGLEFSYKLRRAVPAGLDARLTWRIVAIEPSHKLGGDIIKLHGELSGDDGRIYIEGQGALLLIEKAGKTAIA
ncbi:MAG: MaoC family dehydratase [Hyphomicrobiaceae bacterium]|nr:MaoC family dehydratase [Hyphomicrobiaceae bacterium]